MKKKLVLIMSCSLFLLLLIACSKQPVKDSSKQVEEPVVTEEAVITYKDGTYEVATKPSTEGYYTKATATIKDGKFTEVDWTIYDANRDDRPFDETYEEVFNGNETYIQQCREDWAGSREYASAFIETQKLFEVDVVSGATWTNGKFKSAMRLVIEQAQN